MSNQENNTAQNSVLNTIHKVEGFDPAAYAVPYVDLNTGETRKRLPVMAQMAWFRLVYREGKIAVSVTPGKDCFVATARVYPSYKDPADSYLAEATASRTFDPSKPSVSPREWAQTAAVGIALRNAGFGLQFGAAGDDFLNLAPNELGITVDPIPAGVPQEAAPTPDGSATGTAPVAVPAEPPEPKRELTPDVKYNSELVARLINTLMRMGKKSVAQKIVYSAFESIKAKKKDMEPLEVFIHAVENVKPKLEVKSRRVGGATYQVPVEVPNERQTALAIRWITTYSQAKKGKSMVDALASELLDAFDNTGASVKKKEDTQKMAQANKAFAHYRW